MPTVFQPERIVGGLTNAKRAASGLEPIVAYGLRAGLEGESLETVASDLLSDVLHLAAASGLNPERFLEDVIRRARGHYISESATEPYENDDEPEFAKRPAYNAKDILGKIDRHYIVHGHVPGDDDDTADYVCVPAGSKKSAWQIFVEEHLYGGDVHSKRDWNRALKRGDRLSGLPKDWHERDPGPGETVHGEWAYSNGEFEIPGPPL